MSENTCTNHARSLVMTLAAVLILNLAAFAQTNEFAYQGQLQSSSAPANGSFDFEFVLFDAGGSQVGSVAPRNGVSVVNGIFSVNLDFGSSFPGGTRFLEIRVRQAGGGAFTTLSPRQPVTSSPYSIKSLSTDNATNATQLGGVPANQYLQTNGNGSGLTNLNASSITTGTLANARLGEISTANIADNAVTAPKIAAGQVVKALNGLTDNVTLAEGTNITITPSGNTLTISSTSGGGVNGSGTTNTVPLWTGGTTLGNSVITQSGGNVGVGTTTPGARLQVISLVGPAISGTAPGTSTGVSGMSVNGIAVYGLATGNGDGVRGESNNGAGVEAVGNVQGSIALRTLGTSWFRGDTTPLNAANAGPGTGIAIGSGGTSGYIQAFDYGAFQSRTLLLNNSGGAVEIGTSIPNQTSVVLDVNGRGRIRNIPQLPSFAPVCFSQAGDLLQCGGSSLRWKTNIQPFRNGLDVLKLLEPISYSWKDDGGYDIGLGAEDVAKVAPSFASTDANGEVQGVKYERLNMLLINAIKEQQIMIEKLSLKVRRLERANTSKKARSRK